MAIKFAVQTTAAVNKQINPKAIFVAAKMSKYE